VTLDPVVRELARGANFGVLTTRLASGDAMTHVMWVDADDDHVLVNTEIHRAKFRAVQRDQRVTLTIWAADDPYHYVEVRGHVVDVVRGQVARDHIDALSQKYRGRDFDPANIASERVILRIAPHVQHVH